MKRTEALKAIDTAYYRLAGCCEHTHDWDRYVALIEQEEKGHRRFCPSNVQCGLTKAQSVRLPKCPPSTPEQQLAFCAVRCAELQARLYRLQGKANEALMWLCANDAERAKQAIAQTMLDL